ncbi:MAG: hypothetical protein ACRCX2_04360 [Paraclostridium sp.]
MKLLSTGEPSTLRTYRKIAMFINNMDEQSSGVKFIDEKIKSSKKGLDEEVLADERQMIYILGQMLSEDLNLKASNTSHELKGKTVTIKNGTYKGQEYVVEDYWHLIQEEGKSWYNCNGNPACIKYGIRSAKEHLPIDDEVLYGKIGWSGELIHLSEIIDD